MSDSDSEFSIDVNPSDVSKEVKNLGFGSVLHSRYLLLARGSAHRFQMDHPRETSRNHLRKNPRKIHPRKIHPMESGRRV